MSIPEKETRTLPIPKIVADKIKDQRNRIAVLNKKKSELEQLIKNEYLVLNDQSLIAVELLGFDSKNASNITVDAEDNLVFEYPKDAS